jgi:hypothetical protein
LNSRPQPYQGCALPLSYGSTFRGRRAYEGGPGALSTRPFDFTQDEVEEVGRDGHVAGMTAKDKEREERLAAALRENLKRRKAQSREIGAKDKKGERES